MDSPAGMGSVEIGYANATYAVLTADLVAALESTVTKCVYDGRAFTLRLYWASSTQVVSTVVSPSTPVKFGYKLQDVSAEQRDCHAQGLLDSVIDGGEVTIGIPED